ncbi:MAG: TetR/AcrR family transcriptional regulator [Phenylobacterium sp.]|nr:MAG: TetR/AcrR family transcriptional regulator [Phenylobacterium sp.]
MSSAAAIEPRRQPKGDKRARTRAKLVQAAIELVREKGFERTTLADVAQRAGVTTGAIYGNFANRDELFLAVAHVRAAPIIPQVHAGMSFAEHMRALAEAVVAAVPARRDAIFGTLSFQAYTLTHEEIRQQVLANSAEVYRRTARGMLALLRPEDLPMPAETLVRVLHAMTDGLLLKRIQMPELVPDEVIYAAFAAIAGERSPEPS